MNFLSDISNSVGLSGLGAWGPLLVGVVLIFIVVKLLSLPFKLVWNGILGALMLWLFNLVAGFFGYAVKITVLKALIAGFFGVIGAAAVILFEFFG
ncbi:MAG: pro-sigmaK processing inhibitor BofA family protein [Phascolarctobacterium sp.]|nr:pro-sigmaK processing inhibitor BofA family protein [Phascolarctobacterium sp.]